MYSQRIWNEYEVALLVQAYLNIQIGQKDFDSAAKELSNTLRNYAQSKGIEIDDQFRNEAGIKMKLRNIEYLYTDGKSGLSGCSQQDRKIVELQKKNSKEFNSLLKKAIDKCSVDSSKHSSLSYYSEIDRLPIADKYKSTLKGRKLETIQELIVENYRVRKGCVEEDKSIGKALNAFHDETAKVPFCKLLGIDANNYEYDKIHEKQFSTRTSNFLSRHEIQSVQDLLNISYEKLTSMRNCGATSVAELENFFVTECFDTDKANNESHQLSISKNIRNNRGLLYAGDFAEARNRMNTESEVVFVDKCEDAFNDLGDMINLSDETQRNYLYFVLKEINKSLGKVEKLRAIIEKLHIPKEVLNAKAKYFVEMYSASEEKRNVVRSIYGDDNDLVGDIVNKKSDDYYAIEKFLQWCSINAYEEFNSFIAVAIKDGRMLDIVMRRAEGKTLKEIGEAVGVTRERVRQIEAKVVKKFAAWNGKMRLLCHICASRNNDTVLTPVELNEYFNENTTLALYLFRNAGGDNYQYDKDLDVFIVGDETLADRCSKYVDQLPETIKESQLVSYIENGEDLGITEEILMKAISAEYMHTNNMYHRSRLSLTNIYSAILQEYYEEGLHIYDTNEMAVFRNRIKMEYGDIPVPENDRAISARIADIGILCGRGIYKPKQEKYISKELENKIYSYINNSNLKIFPTNMLFSMFEEELQEFGIENKYYLHGVLRELMGSKFCFRRDYISKDGASDSFYVDIINFIKSCDYPVDKNAIKQKYPGVTEIVIQFAVSDSKVLNFFGKYIHASKLRVEKSEIDYLEKVLNYYLSKSNIVHSFDVYNYVEQDRYSLLSTAGIYNQYSLFSVLEYLFSEKYEFRRPFIGMAGTKIERPTEQIQELILGSDELLISDIKGFAKENRFQIPGILDFIDGFNTTHLLKDDKSIINIESAGVTEDIALTIETLILDELEGTVAINQLQSIYKFPTINVAWTDWLVYSVIKKWSNKLEVKASDIFFDSAVPLVSRVGQMDIDNAGLIDKYATVGIIDNLDDIDSLIMDEIEEEFEGL